MRKQLMLVASAALALVGPDASATAFNKSVVFLHCEGHLTVKDGARSIEKTKKIRRVWIARDGNWIEIYQNGVKRYPRKNPVSDPVDHGAIWSYDSSDHNQEDIKIQLLTFTPFHLGLGFHWRQISTDAFVIESLDCTVAENPFMRTDNHE